MEASQDTLTNGGMQSIKSSVEPQLHNVREHLPDRRQVVSMLSWLVIGLAVAMVGGVTFTGGALFLALVTPIMLFLSPILLTAGGILLFGTVGVAIAAGIGLAAVSAVVWLYRYLKGEEPVYYDRVDAARSRIAGTATEVKDWALDHVPHFHAAASSA